MEPTLDQVREELAGIHDELIEIPKDAFGRRAELKSRQNELRQLSHHLAEGTGMRDPAVLRAAFDRLQQLRDQVLATHLKPQATATGFAGVETDFTLLVNRAIDEGAGLKEIESQLEETLKQLRSSQQR
ncbi:MAG: hypothetical protein IH943_00100 [Acidobacteria bacterium]|nr:hypothetical protein [Acidobacteriota bacterium]